MSEIKFGERIRQVRKNAGCSQKEFCAALDIPQSTLSAYETDRMQPTISSLVKIAEKYNVSLDWLCGIEKSAPSFCTMGEALGAVYDLSEIEGLEIEFTVNDRLPDDISGFRIGHPAVDDIDPLFGRIAHQFHRLLLRVALQPFAAESDLAHH